MMSALVRFSIRFSGVIIGLASLIVIYGVYSLTRSNLDVFPEFSPTQLAILLLPLLCMMYGMNLQPAKLMWK